LVVDPSFLVSGFSGEMVGVSSLGFSGEIVGLGSEYKVAAIKGLVVGIAAAQVVERRRVNVSG
jgi:hypothetical protein